MVTATLSGSSLFEMKIGSSSDLINRSQFESQEKCRLNHARVLLTGRLIVICYSIYIY